MCERQLKEPFYAIEDWCLNQQSAYEELYRITKKHYLHYP